ncbi:MAG: NAD(P)H-hydrate epimerase [Balneolales bacterium]
MVIPSEFQLATSEQSKRIDSETIQDLGISGRMLMEIAGAKAAAIIQKHVNPGSRALIFCGKGNNAGDGLVAARFLSQNNIAVSVVFAEGTKKLTPNALANFKVLEKLKNNQGEPDITLYEKLPDPASLPPADIIIDALLGVGIKNEIRTPYDLIIKFINQSGSIVYALDIPTGLHANNGNILGSCVRADYTFSFGTQKIGCFLDNGPGVSGERIFCDLGFPRSLKSEIKRYAIVPAWVDRVELPKRSPRHKYEAGIVYIIAGSPGLCGAAVMAAESAWAEGLGSVSLMCPRGLLEIFESHLVHQTKFVVGDKTDTVFKPDHLDEILKQINRREGTVVIGPGLGRNKDTAKFVRQLVQNYQGKIVIDADAIWAVSEDLSILNKARVVLTPHPGELKYLSNRGEKDSFDRILAVEEFCREYKVYMLSKGLPNILGSPDKQSFITQYDSTIFARTGFGDILTGKIAALWELTDNPIYSCAKALLDGKSRYDEHFKHYSTIPGPLNLI